MNAATLHARVVLAAMSLAALLVLVSTLASPVAAQGGAIAQPTNETRAASKDRDASGQRQQSVQGGGQQAGGVADDDNDEDDRQAAARATESLQGADALIIEDDADATVDRIEIAATDCEVEKGAVVTVDDESGRPATFTNAPDDGTRDADEVDATIETTEDQAIMEVTDDANLSRFGSEDASEDGTVLSFTGITCGRDDGNAAAGDNDGNNAKDDDLENLSCAELLVLFRSDSSSGQQYGDAVALADPEVRARIELCLEKEIVQGTAADGDLPETGGLSLLGLAALGVATAVAGLSVIRGGRR